MNRRSLEEISLEDMIKHPVWRFSHKSKSSTTKLTPASKLPCSSLTGYLVCCQLLLADGSLIWGFLGNIDTNNYQLNEHFITVSIMSGGAFFHLARYHDFDYDDRGPIQLANFLGKQVSEVFPINYDITSIAKGEPNALRGTIKAEPTVRLSRAEIIALALP